MTGAAAFFGGGLLRGDEPHVTTPPYNTLTEQEEIELGRKFAREYEKKVEILHNPSINSYATDIVHRLGNASQRPQWPYQVKVVNSREVNASAIPGGFMYLQRGLLEFVEDENEMVGALAHEIGHVVARHTTNQLMLMFIARNLYQQVKRNILQDNEVIAEIIEALGGPLVMLAQLKYSRENESEADLLGFYEMLRAGWHPNGLIKFFARLRQMEGSRTPVDVMLSDHPDTGDREQTLRRELASVRITAPLKEQSVQFQNVKGVLRTLPAAPALRSRG
jgi:predicted Zn-dependent protease